MIIRQKDIKTVNKNIATTVHRSDMGRYISFIIFLVFIFTGCAQKDYVIEDITTLPQTPNVYTRGKTEPVDIKKLQEFDDIYNKEYFKPWNIKKFSYTKEESMWGFGYEKMEVYGQNYRALTKEWFEKIKHNSNFEDFGMRSLKAVTVKNSDLRVLPTDKPLFSNPEEAGEGFPFDYNQNSAVYLNTPLFVSHYSKDRAWAFVQTSFAAGWIDTRDIAIINDDAAKQFQTGDYAIAVKDNFPLYLENGSFIEYIKLGTLFPRDENGNLLIIAGSSGEIQRVKNENIIKKPILFNEENISLALKELQNEAYGWGGLIGTRDCSSMTRDFFSLFGIYLDRNSSSQVKNGRYVDLELLTSKEKKELILKEAKPFKTLFYIKGHIMLYAGTINNEPVIFHQFWGIRTLNLLNNQGRLIVGKSAFTSLEPGKEIWNFDKNSSLIKRIKGMVIVVE
jgi:hypothetical protein